MDISGKVSLKRIAYYLSISSILVIFIPFLINPSFNLNSYSIFGDYLGLITGLAGVIVTITIFLIQNASKDYSSQLLRMTFFKNKYFMFVLGYIFLALIFFTLGATFEIGNQAKIFAFFVSVGLVFNFVSLLLVASYFMNILNIIKEIEIETIHYIYSRAEAKTLPLIGKISLNKISESKIINQIKPIFDTLNKSISLNQDDIYTECLNSLDKIIRTYLKHTSSFKSLEDKILLELADQSSFIIKTMIKYENQKFMDKFSLFLGNIGSYILEYRYNIGGVNNHALSISNLLFEIFLKSYNFDRTSAPKYSISGISKLVKKCIQKEYYQSAPIYYHELKKIMDLCIKTPSFWSANLIQYAFNEIKEEINECVLAVQNKKGVELHFLRSLFLDIFETIKKSSQSFSATHYDMILNSMFNLESVFVKISKVHPQLPVYKKVPDSILNPLLDNYVDLCKKILEENNIDIRFMFFYCFPELIFLTKYIQKADDRFNVKHEELFASLLKRLHFEFENEKQSNLDNHYFYTIEDYFSIMIYSKDKNLCEKQLSLLVKKYNEILKSKKISERNKNRIYGLLKIIGALMEGEDEFKSCQESITRIISPNFKEYKQIGKALPSFFEQYDYPTFKHTFDDWFISPLSIWNPVWQDQINAYFDKKYKFINYHKKLKKLQNSKKN